MVCNPAFHDAASSRAPHTPALDLRDVAHFPPTPMLTTLAGLVSVTAMAWRILRPAEAADLDLARRSRAAS